VRVKSLSKPRNSIFAKKGNHGSVSISEQKRPLLLGQEVRELGRNRELVLYEGIRPILARKNRYFEDRFFKRRLLSPPKVATTALLSVRPALQATVDPGPSVDPWATEPPKRRRATPEDLENIEQLTLDDFDIDFDKVVLPHREEGELFSREELDAAVGSFLNALREP
jgi:type IV secretion system protein VirD4